MVLSVHAVSFPQCDREHSGVREVCICFMIILIMLSCYRKPTVTVSESLSVFDRGCSVKSAGGHFGFHCFSFI